MNREELNAELSVLDLTEKLSALKEKVGGGDTSEKTRTAYQDAKKALFDARQETRKNRAVVAPDDGVAEPEPVKTKAG